MKIDRKKFINWMENQNLKDKSIINYLGYFDKLISLGEFNQENVDKLLSESNYTVTRSLIRNLKRYLLTRQFECQLNSEDISKIQLIDIPKQTGRTKKKIHRTLSEEQVKRLADSFGSEKLKIMILLTYYAALREDELLGIRGIDFNFKEWKNNPEQYGEVKVIGKGDQEEIALIPPELMQLIIDWINLEVRQTNRPQDLLFKMCARRWRQLFDQGLISAGFDKYEGASNDRFQSLHPHSLRHSRATNLLRNGMDIRKVQEVLRHRSITSTQIYTAVTKEDLKEELRKVK